MSDTPNAEHEQAVLATLGHEGVPLSLGEVQRWSRLTMPQVRSALRRLQVAGQVARNGNGYWFRTENDAGAAAAAAMSDTLNADSACATAPNGRHAPHWREWRVAEREGRPVRCESCGRNVWPVCSTCGLPRVGWEEHRYCRPAQIDGSGAGSDE